MDEPVFADWQELIYISYVRTQDAVSKTYQERLLTGTGGERQRQKERERVKKISFGLVLWHINRCRLFNAKSIIDTYKRFYFKQFSLAFVHSLVLFDPKIRLYQVVRLWVGQSGSGSDGNEGVPSIHQISSITRASLSDCLVS